MTPTLVGRIQTRLFLLTVVGIPWSILITPFLLLFVSVGTAAGVLGAAFTALFLVAVIGMGWELVYHAMQQYRWEKDWPAFHGLVTSVNEFVVLVIVLAVLSQTVNFATFLHFFSTWIVMWMIASGPLRAVFLRWRFRGGRLI